MNSHLNNEIFSETGCINKDVLLRYRDGKLRDTEKHEVEKHLVDCHLCSEALEGFALVTGVTAFDEVNEGIGNLTSGTASFNFPRYLAVAASVAAVITLSYFAFRQFDEAQVDRLATSEIISEDDTILQESNEGIVIPDKQPEESMPETVESTIPSQVAQRQPVAGISLSVAEPVAPVSAESEERASITEIADAEVAGVHQVPAESVNDEVKSISAAGIATPAGYAQNVTYVDNRKVIDYSALAKDSEVAAKKLEKSTPSKYQNAQKKIEIEQQELQEGVETKRKVDYLQLLTIPIKNYNEGKYQTAIKEFDELLLINPTDENARFYKGMSLYHLKKYDQSIGLLKPLSSINTQPFSEEALFYVGKSYVALGQKENAIAVFRSIVAKKAFYAERAAKEMRKLE